MDENPKQDATLLPAAAYSPRLLSIALNGVVCSDFIRKQVNKGHLKAQRLGGKSLIILREDALVWLTKRSATEPTAYHAKKKGSSLGPRRELSVLDRAARHFEMQKRRAERPARKPKTSNDNKRKR
jgi:hypothetical protein